jgi:hypothetical protein
MKQYEYENLDEYLDSTDLANIFHVQEDNNIGRFMLTYNINRTLNVIGSDNPSTSIYDIHVGKEDDTWLAISYEYYNTTRLWWLVCKMNNITDPTTQPQRGDKIRVLKEDFISDLLNSIKLS